MERQANRLLMILGFLLSACNYYGERMPREMPPPDRQSRGVQKLNYQVVSNLVFKPHCFRCHSGPNPKAGFDLTSYSSLMESGNIEPSDTDDSQLYLMIDEDQMPPETPLSEKDKQIVFDWIKKGAPEL